MSIKGDLKAHDLSFAEIERLAHRGRIERSKAFRGFFGLPTSETKTPATEALLPSMAIKA